METPIFLREHFNGMYRTEVYYLSKQIADLPMFLITPVIFVTLFYFMVGMNLAVDRFFWCILIGVKSNVMESIFSSKFLDNG